MTTSSQEALTVFGIRAVRRNAAQAIRPGTGELARGPDRRGERVLLMAARGRRPASWRDGLLPVDLLQDRGEHRVVRDRAVLAVHRPEHALAAGLSDQFVEQPIVDGPGAEQLVE